MATQTRRTTRRSARFFRATVKASMVTAWCGLVLLSAVAAHAGVWGNGAPIQGLILNGVLINGMPYNGAPYNGVPIQGMPTNGIPVNGVPLNGLPMNGTSFNGLPTQGVISHDLSLQATTLPREPLSAVQHESLPFHSLSQRALGTPPPSRIGFLSPCSRYRLGPLCL
jgi:hypothetical protein